MKSRLFLLAVIIAISSSTVYASGTRLIGLGVNNWNIDDDFNIWLNPARITSYNNMVVGEMGTKGFVAVGGANAAALANQWGGIHYNTGKFGTFGVYIRRPYTTALTAYGFHGGLVGTTIFTTNIPDTALGAARPFGAGGATAVSSPTGFAAYLAGIAAGTFAQTILAPVSRQFDILWGYRLTDTVSIGAALNYANNASNPTYRYATTAPSTTTGDGEVTTERTSSELGLSFGVDLAIKSFSHLEIAVHTAFPSYKVSQTEKARLASTKDATSNNLIESDVPMNLGTTIRAWYPLTDNDLVIPTFRYSGLNASGKYSFNTDALGDASTKNSAGDADQNGTFTDKLTTLGVDVALNSKVSKNLLLIASIGYLSTTVDQTFILTDNITVPAAGDNDSYTSETTTIPIALALEHNSFDWLTTRLGVAKSAYSTTKVTAKDFDGPTAANTTVNVQAKVVNDPALLSTGAALNLVKDLTLDVTLSQQFLFDGPFLISGVANTLFGQLTAVYKF